MHELHIARLVIAHEGAEAVVQHPLLDLRQRADARDDARLALRGRAHVAHARDVAVRVAGITVRVARWNRIRLFWCS